MKTLCYALLLSGGVLLSAAEPALRLNQVSDLAFVNGKSRDLTSVRHDGDTVLRIKGPGNYQSRTLLPVEPEKIYKLSGFFKSGSPEKKNRFYLGVIPMDSGRNPISSGSVFAVPKTDTALAADAKKGDTVLKVTDASAWLAKGLFSVAFKTLPELKDLPNRNLSPSVKSIRKNGTLWEITLSGGISADYPAGTGIREHRHASTYPYSAAGNEVAPEEWNSFSAILKGEAISGAPFHQWWRGTRYAAIGILANTDGSPDSILLIRNLKLEELTR